MISFFKHRYVALVLIVVITASVFVISVNASGSITQTSQADFQAGTLSSTDANISPGDLKLAYNLNTLTETTNTDFATGTDGGTKITNTAGGEVTLNSGMQLTANSNSSVGSTAAKNAVLDTAHNLLFIGGANVKVINTHGSANPNDYTLAATLTTTSTPPIIVPNDVEQVVLDTINHFLWVVGGGGITVIDTHNHHTLS